MDRAFYHLGKRALDLACALVGGVILAPLLIAIALVVRKRVGSPVLFTQQRPGLHGHPFRLFKFRTMTDARGADGVLLRDADRLTNFGRFLRRTSLDELPELLNVIQGDMSLVGPRPLLPEYLSLYSPEQARRHEVKPGLTGWAQVNGRNAIGWAEKFRLDVWYVDHCSFALDAQILVMTLWAVICGHGISAADHETMPPFLGSANKTGSAP